jgi:DNA-binding transcriptional MerR regulator
VGTKRLADAVVALAATMTEILTDKLRTFSDGQEHRLKIITQAEEQKIALNTIERLLNSKQIAKHLGVSGRTVTNWMRKGYLLYYKLDRRVLFDLAIVQRHLDARYRHGPTSSYF